MTCCKALAGVLTPFANRNFWHLQGWERDWRDRENVENVDLEVNLNTNTETKLPSEKFGHLSRALFPLASSITSCISPKANGMLFN